MKHTARILLLTLGITAQSIFTLTAQQTNNFEDLFDIPDVIYDMAPKVDISPDLYTGRVATSIPLYTYKDNDFEIPISLEYSSSGFKTNQPIGSVGLGWNLKVGGSITRIINGIADERSEMNLQGFSLLVNSANVTDKELLDQGKFYQEFTDETPTFGFSDFPIETTPDIFSFQFGDYKGNFCLGYNHKIHVFNTNHPSGEYKIDVNIDDSYFHRLSFTITTGDGYIYTFDMSKDNSSNIFAVPKFSMLYVVPAMEWPLVSIKAPNGRLVSFEYDDPESNGRAQSFFGTSIDWGEKPWYEKFNPSWYQGSVYSGFSYGTQWCYSVKKITIDDVSIEFNYSDRLEEKVLRPKFLDPLDLISIPTISKLDFFSVNRKYVPLQTYSFKYNYCATIVNNESDRYYKGRPVLFLKKITLPDQSAYQMDYYDENSLYPLIGQGTDHWGYYNNTAWDPDPMPERTDTTNYTVAHPYDVDFGGARMGMLRTLIFPTGGYKRYDYEPNDWSACVTKDLTHDNKQYLHLLGANNYDVGGVRIRRITDYATPNDSVFREFKYCTSRDYEESSGILLHSPRYYRQVYVDFPLENPPINRSAIRGKVPFIFPSYRDVSCYGNFTNTQDETHIAYSQVYESFSDGSYIQYNYSDYNLLPDLEPDTTNKKTYITILSSNPAFVDNFYTKYDSRHLQRGKLISQKYYSNQDQLLYSKENKYDYNKTLNYIPTAAFAYSYVFLSKLFVDDYPLEQVTETNYSADDNSPYSQTTTYQYNDRNLISEVGFKNSKGEEFLKKNKYVTDYIIRPPIGPPDNIILTEMIHRNLIGYLCEEQTLIKKDGNWNLINGTFIKYGGNINTIIKPEEKYILEADQPLTSYTTSELAGPGILNFDNHYKKREVYNKYDSFGNLVYFTKDSTENTVYLWGYSGQYPIAEIKNATYSDVTGKISESTLNSIAAKSDPTDTDMNTINGLRNSLPNAQVTTYTYRPLVGMQTMTDPQGITTYYDYDAFGRLKETYYYENNDKSKKRKVETYDYHYKN